MQSEKHFKSSTVFQWLSNYLLNSFLLLNLISKMLTGEKRVNFYLCRTMWRMLLKSREQNENLKQAKITLMVAKDSHALNQCKTGILMEKKDTVTLCPL